MRDTYITLNVACYLKLHHGRDVCKSCLHSQLEHYVQKDLVINWLFHDSIRFFHA